MLATVADSRSKEGIVTTKMTTRLLISTALTTGVLTLAITPAQAGTVVGRITLEGTPTPGETLPIPTNPETCGSVRPPVEFVDADAGIRYAVVKILGAPGDVPLPLSPPEVDQRDCVFLPRIVVVGVDQPLTVLNNDGFLHNFHTHPSANRPVNIGQPGHLKRMTVSFSKPEIVRVGCDIHPGMILYIVATDTPFVAVTDESGAFSIPNVPAGKYQVSVWHERFGETTVPVTVTGEGPTNLVAQLNAN